jgi:hypothetical protein
MYKILLRVLSIVIGLFWSEKKAIYVFKIFKSTRILRVLYICIVVHISFQCVEYFLAYCTWRDILIYLCIDLYRFYIYIDWCIFHVTVVVIWIVYIVFFIFYIIFTYIKILYIFYICLHILHIFTCFAFYTLFTFVYIFYIFLLILHILHIFRYFKYFYIYFRFLLNFKFFVNFYVLLVIWCFRGCRTLHI